MLVAVDLVTFTSNCATIEKFIVEYLLEFEIGFLGILGHRQIREKTFQKLPRIDEGRPSAPERIVFIHRQLTVNCYDKCPPDDE